MGLAVYVENQLHEREFAGPEVGRSLTALAPRASAQGQLRFVSPHGDTMFHLGQLRALSEEVREIRLGYPEQAEDADRLLAVLDLAIRRRGYLWIAGD